MMSFGDRVRNYRLSKKMTMEEVCGDESELSVRQLSRIEKGQSTPSLAKVYYLASQLGVTVGELTDGTHQELPKRYQELKYAILKVPTYADLERLELRDEQFDEIYNDFYTDLPENEKILISCMQAKIDVHRSRQVDYGLGILEDCFDEVKTKTSYQLADIVLIDLYLSCLLVSHFDNKLYHPDLYQHLLEMSLKQQNDLIPDDLVILNLLLLDFAASAFLLGDYYWLEPLFETVRSIMSSIQDFHLLYRLCALEWKYALLELKDINRANQAYQQAMMYTTLTNDQLLKEKLEKEWERDNHGKNNG